MNLATGTLLRRRLSRAWQASVGQIVISSCRLRSRQLSEKVLKQDFFLTKQQWQHISLSHYEYYVAKSRYITDSNKGKCQKVLDKISNVFGYRS